MALSNAMRLGKRTLAGVAAGALALGALSIAGATSASAKPSIKPKVTTNTATASVGPVRYSTTGSVQDSVYSSPFLFSAVGTDDSKVTNDDTIVVTLLTAPSAASRLWLDTTPGAIFPAGGGSADDTLGLTTDDSSTGQGNTVGGSLFTKQNATSTDDTVLSTLVAVNEGGTYTGNIKIYNGAQAGVATGNLIQTTTFSITTAGKPASIVVDPTSAALVASTLSTKAVAVSLKDASGALTQMSSVDSISVASASTTVATVSPASLTPASFDDSTATVLGTGGFTITATATAGSTTVAATPLGTMGTLAAASVAVTSSAGGATAPTALTLTAPTSQVLDDTNTDDTKGYIINANLVTSYTITGTGATASAGQTATVSYTGGTAVKVNGVAAASGSQVLTTADSSGKVTYIVSATSLPTQFTIQTGAGTKSKWVVVDKVTPAADPTISPAG